jgi:predicted nucleic acid-binding protein
VSVVVDANLIGALVIPLPYSEAAAQKMSAWKQDREEIFAPTLLEYEVITILRKAVVAKLLSSDGAAEALRMLFDLNIQTISPTPILHQHALRWAGRLEQTKAYDAHYIALAQEMRLDFWTADRHLVNSAHQVGATWVRWIDEEQT